MESKDLLESWFHEGLKTHSTDIGLPMQLLDVSFVQVDQLCIDVSQKLERF